MTGAHDDDTLVCQEASVVPITGSRSGDEGEFLLLLSCSVMSDSLRPHGLQHTRLPCPSPTHGAYSNSCPPSRWCHSTISSSVVPFSSCLQYFPASGSFPMSQLFTSGGQSIRVSASASVLPKNIQDWFPLGLTGLISLQSKELSRVFSNTTVQKHQFLGDTVLIYFPRVHNWLYSMLNFEEHRQRIGETLCSIFASFVNLN